MFEERKREKKHEVPMLSITNLNEKKNCTSMSQISNDFREFFIVCLQRWK